MIPLKIFLETPIPNTGELTVQDDFWEYYLTTVKRIREGDNLTLADGSTVAESRVESTDPLRVTILETRPALTPDYDLHLGQAITRKKKFEESIKRGTELGVTEFTPVVSENTVREPNNPEKQNRRWRKIAMDAARITGRDWLPAINPITSFGDYLESVIPPIYFGRESGRKAEECFRNSPPSATLVVGPEGGLTEGEEKRLKEAGAAAVSLGSVNYRAETASIVLSTLWLNAVAPDRDRGAREGNPDRNP